MNRCFDFDEIKVIPPFMFSAFYAFLKEIFDSPNDVELFSYYLLEALRFYLYSGLWSTWIIFVWYEAGVKFHSLFL